MEVGLLVVLSVGVVSCGLGVWWLVIWCGGRCDWGGVGCGTGGVGTSARRVLWLSPGGLCRVTWACCG